MMRGVIVRWIGASAAVGLMVVTAACSGDGGASPPDADSTSTTHSQDRGQGSSPGNPPPEIEVRDFKKLAKDEPGGVKYRTAIPAEPTEAQLEEAVKATRSRADAERFAIILHHALEDQTADSAQEIAHRYLSPDLPADSRFYLDNLKAWKDTRVVPGSRSWLRSADVSKPGESLVVQVHLVEQLETPGLGDGPADPFVSWGSFLMTVEATTDGWLLTDLQEAGASEYETFSPYTWEAALDSGKGWRRFEVG